MLVYAKADWDRMRSLLEETDWDRMETMDPNAASQYLFKSTNKAAQLCIPQKMIQERKSAHPWLTDEVEDLVEAKQAAEGIPRAAQAY